MKGTNSRATQGRKIKVNEDHRPAAKCVADKKKHKKFEIKRISAKSKKKKFKVRKFLNKKTPTNLTNTRKLMMNDLQTFLSNKRNHSKTV